VRAAANREVKHCETWLISEAEPGQVSTAPRRVGLPGHLTANNNDPGLFYDTACHDVILWQQTHDLLQASFCRYLHLCVDPIEHDDRSIPHLFQSHTDHMAAVPMHCLMADHWIF